MTARSPRRGGGHARPPVTTPVPRQPPDLRRGLCVGHPDLHIWSPRTAAEQEAALAICRACPVLEPCRAYALSLRTLDDLAVILGGLTADDRARIRRARQRALRKATAPAPDASDASAA
jgi:WhiB family redox-sensing transcriptional regulator